MGPIEISDSCAFDPRDCALSRLLERARSGRHVLAACDPDSSHPAWALWDGQSLTAFGGGSATRGKVPASLHGACALLGPYADQLAGVAVEDPGAFRVENTKAMAGVFRTRYLVEGACEILRLPCVPVTPATWQGWFTRGETQGRRVKGDTKRAYRAKAKRLWPELAINEDRAAALGILAWLAEQAGMPIPGAAPLEPVKRNRRRAT